MPPSVKYHEGIAAFRDLHHDCINHTEISDQEALTMVSETVENMILRRRRK